MPRDRSACSRNAFSAWRVPAPHFTTRAFSELLHVRGRIAAVARPGAVGDMDVVEAAGSVGVPDVTARGVERRCGHRVPTAGGRLVEVGNLTRVSRVTDVEHPQSGQDHAAGEDARV